MSKYWVYIDDQVAGPYTVDQLIRLRGFSRQARVCPQESGENEPQAWISPADIPELSHIFKAVDETRPVMMPPKPKPKPVSTPPRPRPRVPSTESMVESPRAARRAFPWASVVAFALIAAVLAAIYVLWQQSAKRHVESERLAVRQLVENVAVPSSGGPIPLRQYMEQKNIQPRWTFEKQPTGLYSVSVIWFEASTGGMPTSAEHAFEVNLDAQTVRPVNTRAAKLLNEGDNASAKKEAPAPPSKPKAPPFSDALSAWQTAVQDGDFETVWGTYSERKIQDMGRGGISHTGYIRLQELTHKLENGLQLAVEKIKEDGSESRLVLLKQTQNGRPDVFIKQYWVLENGAWKLDDEEKKSMSPVPAAAPPPAPASPSAPASAAQGDNPTPGDSSGSSSNGAGPSAKPSVLSLPGISH